MKKIISTMLVLALCAYSSIGAYAETYTGSGTHQVKVSAVVESTYTVSVPATLNLSENKVNATIVETKSGKVTGTEYKGTITYGCKGNTQDNQRVVITTDKEFVLTGKNTGAQAVATVTSTVTKWENVKSGNDSTVISPESVIYVDAIIDVVLTKADTYEGSFDITYGMETIE